jgi:chorismate synthase
MKPLPTLMEAAALCAPGRTSRPTRWSASDTTAIAAAAVVGEAVVAFELARCVREKFGGDSTGDLLAAYAHYLERIPWARD